DAAEAEAERLADEDAARPFDLLEGPLVRFRLLRLTETDHVLLFTLHHIIADAWSRGVVFRDLEAIYQATRDGREAELKPLEVQYPDFAAWQRERLSGDSLDELVGYWRDRLTPLPPALELPTDRPRPKVADPTGAAVARQLDAELVDRARELARAENSSLFMVLLSAMYGVLHRYTGQSDLTVGTFIANRNRSQIADLVGFFVNTLAMRTTVDPAASFRALLQASRDTALDAFSHQDLPFEKIIEELHPERDTSSTPFFRTLFVLQNARQRELGLGDDLSMSYLGAEHKHSPFDFTLWGWEGEGDLTLVLDYQTALFDASTMERFLGHFETLLRAALDDPEQPLATLPILDAAARGAVLALGADADAAPAATTVPALLDAAVEAHGDRPAVESGDTTLTYDQLAGRWRRLARHLRDLGVGAESRVALSMPRSIDQVVAMLAVLDAGGAYVPLDPAYPRERLAYMLDDAGARVLLSRSDVEADLPDPLPEGVVRIDVDTIAGALDDLDASPLAVALDPENAAYVIYTSGSTGHPKGVVVPHRAAANYIVDAADAYGVVAEDRALQFASINFDTSVEEIFPTLVRGADLVLRDDAMVASIGGFLDRLGELQISLLNLPTAYWHQICAELASGSGSSLPDGLRKVVIGGEKAAVHHLETWHAEAPASVELVNTYGPTEATIVSTRRELVGDGAPDASALADARREIPLGGPLTGGRVHLLDRHGEPVPVGVPGELVIAGAGVTRGYLGRPAKTAEQFVPDPFAEAFGGEPGSRLYRSGDLAVWREDGELEFRGRVDHQVKVRGFRVELGEIDAALGQHEAIRDAVVDARTEARGGEDLRLVAYLVIADGAEAPGIGTLRDFLGARLPAHMVPQAFVVLDTLPTTPSGKVDRRSLPAPEAGGRLDVDAEFVAPRTDAEALLAAIWVDLLGVERVGLHADFFQLGGHSLLATKLVARVRERFDVEVPLLTVFDTPTLDAMAREIERHENVTDEALPPVVAVPRDGRPIPLSFPQERIWVLDRLQPGNTAYNFVLVVRLQGRLDVDVMQRTLDELVRRHEVYRTVFRERDGHPVQVIVDGDQPAVVDRVDLREMRREKGLDYAAAEGARLTSAEGEKSFDVGELPLIRWLLIQLDEDDWQLGQIEHHFVHDGWSVAIFLREMQVIYEAYLDGRPSPLPDLEVQFADFAHWQSDLLRGDYYDRLKQYWLDTLRGVDLVLELPLDKPRPAVNRYQGQLIVTHFDRPFHRRLHDFNLSQGASLYITMLAAFYALLYRYTGSTTPLIGAGIANRRSREAEQVIGMIVNTIVLKGNVDPEVPFSELLKATRRTVLEAHAHQDMPFEQLVGELKPPRDLARNPVFQVMFAFHDSAVPFLDFGGLTGFLMGAHNSSAKLDLNIVVIPKAEQRAGLDRPDAVADDDDPLIMYWEYNTDLFDHATIEQMIEHYRTLLGAVSSGAVDMPVAALPLGPESAMSTLLARGDRPAELPTTETVHRLFQEIAAGHADAPAVTENRSASEVAETLSYGELQARASRLARRLRELGVGPEVAVGLALERSNDLIVAELAVLEAGGFFVPLDPAYPSERLAVMLDDTGAEVLVAHRGLQDQLGAATASCTLVDLDAEREALAALDGSPLATDAAHEPSGDNLAYVMFTSGSTGRPKGVAVPHRAIVRLVRSEVDGDGFARFGADETWLGFAPAAFDASTLEVWAPLLHGGRLELAPSAPMALEELTELIAGRGVTSCWLTSGLFHQLVDGEHLRAMSSVRHVLAGGDVLDAVRVRAALEQLGDGARVTNGYGPTENTTFTTCHGMTDADSVPDSVPIGGPIPGSRILVADDAMRAAPENIPGELLAAGDGLARGYFGRPALTAERFVPDPSSDRPGARAYRTGDQVRWRSDGTIQFLGRVDFQVKIRGFRIEPGEVRAVLAEHASVRDAVVVVRTDGGDKRLVGYVVLGDGLGDEPVAALRGFLSERLPTHMVPAALVVLDALPLDPNGKIDRRALPAPELGGDADRSDGRPRNETETKLVELWIELLPIEQLGIFDDFFELGGHSLLATRLVSRLRADFGVQIGLGQIFEHPSIAGLAAWLDRARADEGAADDTIQVAGEELDVRAEDLGDADLDALLGDLLEGGDDA
ncbi:MAG: amino acid adenylation domain-containing protein, partial [Acidobacteriota bacterium]